MADYNDEHRTRIKAITKLYYSNPKIIEAMLKFAQNREVTPRYFEGFGKRPDTLQYASDILELVNISNLASSLTKFLYQFANIFTK